MRTTERGFTLLEVLAAIAILGILYTVLTDSAIEGLRSEKTSQRRLEASLLADRRLADLELQLGVGVVPPLGEEEEAAEEDADFTVRVAVELFDLILPELELETGGAAPGPLLADLTTDQRSPLRVIRVTVAWLEAEVEYSVTRTTFGFDVNAIDPARLPQAPGASAPPEDGGEQGQQQQQQQGQQGQQQQQQQRQRQQQQTPSGMQGESP